MAIPCQFGVGDKMKAVHFGAGNIGRGFIGNILHDNGFDTTFVDTNEQIIEQINKDKGYPVKLLDESQTKLWIDNVNAINSYNSKQVEKVLVECNLITTSVGAFNLKNIASILKEALLIRSSRKEPVDILANENIVNASELLKDEIKKICTNKEWESINKIAYFVNTAIDRQALSSSEESGRQVALVEPYYEWVIDKNALNPNSKYQLKNVKLVNEMKPFIERKLFIVNAEHAAFAYLGALLGLETIQETIQQSNCRILVERFMKQNKHYFLAKYDMKETELDQFITNTINRHGNPAVSDDVHRVGRSPIRKLDRYDRLVAPVMELEDLGLENDAGKRVIAAAYLYTNEDDPEARELQQTIKNNGIAETIRRVSKVPESLVQEIAALYHDLKNNSKSIFL